MMIRPRHACQTAFIALSIAACSPDAEKTERPWQADADILVDARVSLGPGSGAADASHLARLDGSLEGQPSDAQGEGDGANRTDGGLAGDSTTAGQPDASEAGGPASSAFTLTIEVMVGTDSGVEKKYGTHLSCFLNEMLMEVNYIYRKLMPKLDINVVLVRHETNVGARGLALSGDGNTLLWAWIDWVKKAAHNPPNGQPKHFDYALLLTSAGAGRGLSPSGISICQPNAGNFVGEEGPMSAKIVAHELGHLFGLGHEQDRNLVMYPMPGTAWSKDSVAGLDKAIAAASSCLKNYVAPPKYVGVPVFTVEQQCQGIFGLPACTSMPSASTQCEKLLCQDANGWQCHYDDSVLLDGSPCGANKWCINGACVNRPVGGFTELGSCDIMRLSP